MFSSYISIHAPTKGATFTNIYVTITEAISIHAPTKGATAQPYNYYGCRLFQSTLPRRERLSTDFCNPATALYFNPRSHEGSDGTKLQIDTMRVISIHAPTKGATAIFHKIINLYCETSTNNPRINSLNINQKYINRIKARFLNYFFGANHLINLCKLYIRTYDL